MAAFLYNAALSPRTATEGGLNFDIASTLEPNAERDHDRRNHGHRSLVLYHSAFILLDDYSSRDRVPRRMSVCLVEMLSEKDFGISLGVTGAVVFELLGRVIRSFCARPE